jgi:ferredoxin
MSARVSIDGEQCAGHGCCYMIAPELFTDDESGFGQGLGDGDVPGNLLSQAEAARLGCPERAITLWVD